MKKTEIPYPIMAFRVSPKDKARLEELLDDAHKSMGSKRTDDGYKYGKKDLIVDALYYGLIHIKKHRRLLKD